MRTANFAFLIKLNEFLNQNWIFKYRSSKAPKNHSKSLKSTRLPTVIDWVPFFEFDHLEWRRLHLSIYCFGFSTANFIVWQCKKEIETHANRIKGRKRKRTHLGRWALCNNSKYFSFIRNHICSRFRCHIGSNHHPKNSKEWWNIKEKKASNKFER